ncbi:MAG: grasp-with-spasm system SPASM domain peptide maturase [Ginsengibacter sp.]
MEQSFFEKNKTKYVYIFEDCQLVKGFSRTSICDLSRKRIFFINNSYYQLTAYFKKNTIGEIGEMLDDKNSRLQFYKFLSFLLDEQIGILVDDITAFPHIPVYWDSPSEITNAIIDIRIKWDFLEKALTELSQLRCQFLQLRFYKEVNPGTIEQIVSLVKGKCFKDVEMLLKYSGVKNLHESLSQLTESQKNIRFLIHSTPRGSGCLSNARIRYSEQCITSCGSCGNINPWSLSIPSVQGFMENKLFNSCLNRKISIDENGRISNCPSMKKKYGNIAEHSLAQVARKKSFKKLWNLNKDIIDTCKDCEFRYICSDCRAYTEDGTLYGKPAKCSYDPYTASWKS